MVAYNKNELSKIIFGSGFKGITDIQTGPDGYLYILTYLDGNLYRIVPNWNLLYIIRGIVGEK